MGLLIGIGNFINNKKIISINKNPSNEAKILTELGTKLLTENSFYILRDYIEDFYLDSGKLDINILK